MRFPPPEAPSQYVPPYPALPSAARLSGLVLAVLVLAQIVSQVAAQEQIKKSDPPANDPAGDSYILVIKSAIIAKTKANGKAWDPGVGKVSWPDPFVKVKVFDKDGGLTDNGETSVIMDSFTPVWNQEKATVKVGHTVKLEVWDKDLKFDDEIGKHNFVVTADMVKAGELTLKFGQVERLNLGFRETKKVADSRILLQQPHPGPNSAKNLQRAARIATWP